MQSLRKISTAQNKIISKKLLTNVTLRQLSEWRKIAAQALQRRLLKWQQFGTSSRSAPMQQTLMKSSGFINNIDQAGPSWNQSRRAFPLFASIPVLTSKFSFFGKNRQFMKAQKYAFRQYCTIGEGFSKDKGEANSADHDKPTHVKNAISKPSYFMNPFNILHMPREQLRYASGFKRVDPSNIARIEPSAEENNARHEDALRPRLPKETFEALSVPSYEKEDPFKRQTLEELPQRATSKPDDKLSPVYQTMINDPPAATAPKLTSRSVQNSQTTVVFEVTLKDPATLNGLPKESYNVSEAHTLDQLPICDSCRERLCIMAVSFESDLNKPQTVVEQTNKINTNMPVLEASKAESSQPELDEETPVNPPVAPVKEFPKPEVKKEFPQISHTGWEPCELVEGSRPCPICYPQNKPYF